MLKIFSTTLRHASLKGARCFSNKMPDYRPLYFDTQSTTPIDPRVLDAMMVHFVESYGNPHSKSHAFGWEGEESVENARKNVANVIGANSKEIFFTSGATESNNLVIKGVANFYSEKKRHVITTQTSQGFDVTYLPVSTNGLISLEELEKAIRPDTGLVSIMYVNNEIGVIQPIEGIGKLCRSKGIFFHTDAAQAVGKIPIDVNKANIDLLSISGHKVYGPKGVGALYMRRKPRVRLTPLFSGGGQERGIRSGTLPTALVVGLGEACRISSQEMQRDYEHISGLANRLINGITSQLDHVYLNGDEKLRYPGCVNISFAYVEGESLLMALNEIALSSGSACTSASLEPSYVLRAIGSNEDLAHSSIRFGISRFTTQEEVDFTIDRVVFHVKKLREISPLWEMVCEGIDIKSIKWSSH